MTDWFTADQHYGHEMIIEFEFRPFKNTREMDAYLIDRHNSMVEKTDTVYMIGDFCLQGRENTFKYQKLIKSLNGRKILILGNHDLLDPFKYVDMGFESVHTSLRYEKKSVEFYMIHDPAVAGVMRNKLFVHGHVHKLFTRTENSLNVGVDVQDYTPVPFDSVVSQLI